MNHKFLGLAFITFANLALGNESVAAVHDRTFSEPDAIVTADVTFIKTLLPPDGADQMTIDCGQFKLCNMYQLKIKDTLLGKFESQTIQVLIPESESHENNPLNNRLLFLEKNETDSSEYHFGATYTVSRSAYLLNGEYCFYFEQKELGKGTYKSFVHSSYWCYEKNKLLKKL